jgi:hypothetical protein
MASSARVFAAIAAASLLTQATGASAQTPRCVTEQEVSAIAIYSVPSLVQSVRQRCAGELASSGYLARRGDALSARYATLQPAVWPRAKAGLLKLFAGAASASSGGFDTITALPDDAVRPFVDALIVQESAPRIALRNCTRIERAIEVMAPLDPEVAGTLLGVLVGFAESERIPVCPARRA